MATFDGNAGEVGVGANIVAEVRNWSLTESVQIKQDNALGDTFDTHKVGRAHWQGTMTCWWDDTDTNGQEALTKGASVTLNLYAEGDPVGADKMSGTALITEVGVAVDLDGIVERTFSFLGNSALTHGVVS